MKNIEVVAIQKRGNLTDESTTLLQKIGINTYKNEGRIDYIEDKGVRVLFLRYADIIRAVSHGFADIGIVGSDTIPDVENESLEYINLPIGLCQIVLAVKNSSRYFSAKDLKNKVIATGFISIGTNYFNKVGVTPEWYYTQGSAEAFCCLGYVDAIIDIKNTGKSLEVNGLRVIDIIQKINAILIFKKGYKGELLDKIKELI